MGVLNLPQLDNPPINHYILWSQKRCSTDWESQKQQHKLNTMKLLAKTGCLWAVLSLAVLHLAQAQLVTADPNRPFFQKGNTYFSLNQDFTYNAFNLKFDGEDILDEFSLRSRLQWNRAVTDKVGVGARDRADQNILKDDNDGRFLGREWTFSVGGDYVFDLGGDKQLITGFQVGYGQINNKSEFNGNENESKDDLIIAGVNVAYPIQLYQSDLFIVPKAGYRFRNQSGDNQDIDTHSFFAGFDLYSSIPCQGWWYNEGVNMKEEYRYTPGTQMWGSGTKLRYKRSNITSDFVSGGQGEETENRFLVGVDYSYYVAKNFSLGGRASFNTTTTSDDNSDFKTTSTNFEVVPRLRWHFAKGWWNDVYLEGAGGFSSSKVDNNGSSENKVNTVIAEGGLGKFWPLTPNLFLNSTVRYAYNKSEDPDDSDEQELERTGLQVSLRLNYSF